MEPDTLRKCLDRWANASPRPPVDNLPANCACEHAQSPTGTGPVGDDEKLLYFYTSRRNIDLKHKAKFKPNSFNHIFEQGLSMVRERHCDDAELAASAKLVADGCKRAAPAEGGVISVLRIQCNVIRAIGNLDHMEGRAFCVYETPAGHTDKGFFERPSHADVACARKVEDQADRLALRAKIFEVIRRSGNVHCVYEFRSGALRDNAPAVFSNLNEKWTCKDGQFELKA